MATKSSRVIKHVLALRNRHFFGLDVLLLLLTPTLALLLRTDGLNVQPQGWDTLTRYVPGLLIYTGIALLVRLAVFYRFGLYSRYWRYASIEELDQISWAVFVSSAFIGLVVLLARTSTLTQMGFPLWNFPRSVVFIDALLVLFLLGGIRFSVRLANRWQREDGNEPGKRALIMGAGDAGAMTAREMRDSSRIGFEPIGFVDDDPGKKNMRIHGIPVLGNRHDIPRLVQNHKIQYVIIAMPTAPGREIREIVRSCEQAGVQTKILPGIYELLDGTVNVSNLRNVDIEDLLRREPVQTDVASVQRLLQGKRVLVTGGGGSIGSELCRQIRRCRPAEIIIVGHGENSVFEIYNELSRLEAKERPSHPVTIHAVIADIRFAWRIQTIMARYRPHVVFHAAAHKHVPLMEGNPAEAITNNVLGTRNVLQAAQQVDVERFVMISTDKAVNPTNVMGASKRTAELLVHQAALATGKPYVAVRFGNVLGSRGSVILTFKQQIADGGPVCVTHPDMTRYFMTIPEAVQLVLQSAVMGHGGEVFVLDMGEPVKIMDLARDLITLSGLEVGIDIEIAITGLRPGEKLYEELFIPGESYDRTEHHKIFIATNASSFVKPTLDRSVDMLIAAAEFMDEPAILRHLQNLIPEAKLVDANERTVAGHTAPSIVHSEVITSAPLHQS
ncbi:MAG: polysaccharide biosynthesis protein [Caldilineaceae bacterium]|nr:polysaccharide biosynthesis protein [Caldilineaceae bacterium]